jgi:Ribonuclease G/E
VGAGMTEEMTDDEVIRDFEENVVKPLKLNKERVKVVEISQFGYLELSPEEILEHMKAKDEIGMRHIEVHKHYLEYVRRKPK